MKFIDSITLKNGEVFSDTDMNYGDVELAFRVPEDAEAAVLMVANLEESDFVIKSADSVFGGKELTFHCGEHGVAVFVDLNIFIQRSGEYKGCVLLETESESFRCKMLVLEK